MNIVFIALMLISYKNIYFFFLAWYLNQIFSSLVLVVNPVIGATQRIIISISAESVLI